MDAFVYGTLCDPKRAAVSATWTLTGRSTQRPSRVDARYPTLVPGGSTGPRLLRLGDGDLAALDAYEGVERGLYVRVRVPGADADLWTYVGDPTALGVAAEWPGDGRFRDRVRRFVETRDVRVVTERAGGTGGPLDSPCPAPPLGGLPAVVSARAVWLRSGI